MALGRIAFARKNEQIVLYIKRVLTISEGAY